MRRFFMVKIHCKTIYKCYNIINYRLMGGLPMHDREKSLVHFRNPEVRAMLQANIEKYRKGDGTVTVLDAAGKPVAGASVKLVHKKHECKFGANLFMLEEFETPEKNERYKQYFSELFTMATLPFYWSATEPEKGHFRYEKGSSPMYRRPPIDLCMEFCAEMGIEPREHALAYDFQFPKWLKGLSPEEVKIELERRYQEISSRYADKIPTIEVTNEMNWPEGMNVTSFYEQPDFLTWCYEMAEKYFPNSDMLTVSHEVDELTAYLIGWTDGLGQKSQAFLQETEGLR